VLCYDRVSLKLIKPSFKHFRSSTSADTAYHWIYVSADCCIIFVDDVDSRKRHATFRAFSTAKRQYLVLTLCHFRACSMTIYAPLNRLTCAGGGN